jgi:hypothetical protein
VLDMGARVVRVAVAVGLTVALLAACGDDDTASTERSTTTSTTVAGLADGVHFGYLREYTAGHNFIYATFDEAELLTGDEALAATEAAGYEEPTDYFIRNEDESVVEVNVDPEAEVLDIRYGTDDCCDPLPSDPVRFAMDREAAEETQNTVEITVEDGVVVKLEEIFFP